MRNSELAIRFSTECSRLIAQQPGAYEHPEITLCDEVASAIRGRRRPGRRVTRRRGTVVLSAAGYECSIIVWQACRSLGLQIEEDTKSSTSIITLR